MMLSPKAEALIINFEGWDVPWRWPEGDSGITLPVGYDLGYEQHFDEDWGSLLPVEVMARLRKVKGLTGRRARDVAPSLRGILIPRDAAIHVFDNVTVPRYIAQTIAAFPKADQLPPDAFGALVSIVFNRGPKITDDPGSNRRREMMSIHNILAHEDPTSPLTISDIAGQVRSMARLWQDNPDSDGDLHDRRMQEANLIAHSLDATK